MSWRGAVIGGILGFFGLVGTCTSLYTVNQKEQAVVTEFGKPVKVILNPIKKDEEKDKGGLDSLKGEYAKKGIKVGVGAGLYAKLPWQSVTAYERRLLEWDGYPEEIPTKDKKYIWVDVVARWYIEDPLKFMETVKTEEMAHGRLDDIIDGVVRNEVTDTNLIEVVRSSNRKMEVAEKELEETVKVEEIREGRNELSKKINQKVREACYEYGIEIHEIGVLFKSVSYVESVKAQIEGRMRAERIRIADRYISEGEGEFQKIMGDKERDNKKIRSEAYKTAKEIEGKADAEATKIYADAYSKDPKFYQFLRTLELYKEKLGKDTRLIIGTDNDLLRYLKKGESK